LMQLLHSSMAQHGCSGTIKFNKALYTLHSPYQTKSEIVKEML
jgi:hypothetical protein